MSKIRRLFEAPSGSFFLFGPRGTGKSTWVRSAFPKAHVLDLLHPAVCRELSARPERLVEIVDGARSTTIVIDEVQKVPALLDVVHALVEERRNLIFVLTGSSARKLKQSGTDLLAGRAALRSMHPFLAAELGPRFSLDRSLRSGLVPVVFDADDPDDVLASYVALYVRQEVQNEGLVRSIGDFDRFLEVVSFSQGSQLNASNVARDCSVGRGAVLSYLSILEDLLVAFRVASFTARAKRAVVQHPKFFFFDTGVWRSLRPAGPLDRPEEIDGVALEGLVAQHLHAYCSHPTRGAKLFFWRTRGGSEVDFVVYGAIGFWSIEVKNTGVVRSEDVRSLKTFHDDYPECRPLLLYRGSERFVRDGILCVGVDEFLRQLVPGRPLDADV